jgi:hypothetical protein
LKIILVNGYPQIHLLNAVGLWITSERERSRGNVVEVFDNVKPLLFMRCRRCDPDKRRAALGD